jgi:hypothetical protein
MYFEEKNPALRRKKDYVFCLSFVNKIIDLKTGRIYRFYRFDAKIKSAA